MANQFLTKILGNSILNTFIFQLVKVKVVVNKESGQLAGVSDNPEIKEMATLYLATNPADIQFDLSSRASTGLTKDGTPFLQEGGMQIGRYSLKGTMGKEARLVGLIPKSGDTRLREFREMIFKLSNAINDRDIAQTTPLENRIELNSFLRDKIGSDFQGHRETEETVIDEFFAINYYDFYNRIFSLVKMRRFSVYESALKNHFPEYEVEMELLSPPLEVRTQNFMLLGLSEAVKIFAKIEDEVSSLDQLLTENKYVATALGNTVIGLSLTDFALNQVNIIGRAFSKTITGRRVIDLNPLGSKINNFIRAL